MTLNITAYDCKENHQRTRLEFCLIHLQANRKVVLPIESFSYLDHGDFHKQKSFTRGFYIAS